MVVARLAMARMEKRAEKQKHTDAATTLPSPLAATAYTPQSASSHARRGRTHGTGTRQRACSAPPLVCTADSAPKTLVLTGRRTVYQYDYTAADRQPVAKAAT